ncbi:hypothetical protein [Vibrio furnissii]|uniref:hypothetical protein n=1 Tax=Vibrio furnissii TaxID=29494 RepID=UPI0005A50605|nr:hypothetical protein [Vibrio furnissii]
MALNNTLTITRDGFEGELRRPDCYVVINTISGGKHGLKVSFFYKESTEGDVLSQGSFTFVPNVDGENYHEQAYQYMKASLPEFATAKDC